MADIHNCDSCSPCKKPTCQKCHPCYPMEPSCNPCGNTAIPNNELSSTTPMFNCTPTNWCTEGCVETVSSDCVITKDCTGTEINLTEYLSRFCCNVQPVYFVGTCENDVYKITINPVFFAKGSQGWELYVDGILNTISQVVQVELMLPVKESPYIFRVKDVELGCEVSWEVQLLSCSPLKCYELHVPKIGSNIAYPDVDGDMIADVLSIYGLTTYDTNPRDYVFKIYDSPSIPLPYHHIHWPNSCVVDYTNPDCILFGTTSLGFYTWIEVLCP